MNARIERWGDSLALRIPDALTAQTGFADQSVVDLSLVAGKLVITPLALKPSLAELLKQVTPENLHGEWETGPAVGGEVW